MTSQSTACAVRSCFTNKGSRERHLGRLVHCSEWHCGSSHHSQCAQREKLSPVCDIFFLHDQFSEEVEWMDEHPFLFCFLVYFFKFQFLSAEKMKSFADVYIFLLSFFILLAVLTPLKIASQRTHMLAPHLSYIHKYTDLPPVLLLLQMKIRVS